MSNRTALLICCSVEEAASIRNEAEGERRTVSNYVLNIVMRTVAMEEDLLRPRDVRLPDRMLPKPTVRSPGPRTAILIRCSIAEARKIRAIAKRKETTISGFVLQCLRRSWNIKIAGPHPTIAELEPTAART